MSRNDDSIMSRFGLRRPQPAINAPEPEWRETLRDLGLMVSGIYQDLRGDAHENWRQFSAWIGGLFRRR